MIYDLAIIGGGPAGYTAAEKAAKHGLNVILFEKDKIGGTCLNRGCIPTKCLIHSSQLFKKIETSLKHGIEVENYSYDYLQILNRKNEVVNLLRSSIEKTEKKKITIIYQQAKICKTTLLKLLLKARSKNILIATGSIVAKAPIKG